MKNKLATTPSMQTAGNKNRSTMDNLIIMTAKTERDHKFIQLVCRCRKIFLQIMVER